MSNFLNKIPVSPITSLGSPSIPNDSTIGTNFSILQTGGYMEVYSLSGLTYTIPPSTTGVIEFSGNSIPIQFTKGTGAVFSPDVLILNSDNISSGRRKLGMLSYVYETNKIYQFNIDNYDTLWNNATGATGPGGATVVISDYGTTVKSNSVEGIAFISAWTSSTISGIGGYNDTNASWRVLSTSGTFTGGTVSGATIFTDGLTANTISATTYQNLPQDIFVTGGTYSNSIATFTNNTGGTFNVTGLTTPFTGGTVSGATIFTDGLTANTISATTYQNLPQDIFVTGGTYTSGNAIFTNNTGGTFTVTGFSVGSGGGEIFYLNLSQSEGSNRLLSTTGSTSSQQTSGVTISSGVTSSIASFQSQQLNTILIPGGVWSFHLHSYKEDLSASFDIFVEVYKITSGGTQTLLFQTEPITVLTDSPSPSMQITEAYFSGTSVVVSDSVVTTVRATNTGNQSKMITFVTEGTIYYSYVISTLPTQPGLTCDTLSGCSIIQTIQVDINNKFDKSGGTINGNLTVTGDTTLQSLTASTISATTYQNLPATPFLPLSGGTVTGDTIFTGNLSANTISATTISGGTVVLNSTNLPSTPTVFSAFTDDYNRVTLSPGGSPSLTYTNTNTGAGNTTIVSNYLNIANGNPAGQSYTTVPLSGFGSPFNPTLSLNTINVEWTFNLRTNRASIFSGFGVGQYGGAVVLAGTSGTLQNIGNGYALVYGGSATRNWRLVRYTNGLSGTLTDIISGGVFASNTSYVSVRIVYTPSTNTWTYYFRDDGTLAWGDPTTVTTLIGSATDSTYTASLMSSFGVFFNYSTAANQNLQFDNLAVKLSTPSVFTPQSYLTLKNYTNTTVFDVKDDGSVTSTGLISSTGGISGTTISGGTYFGNGSALTLGQFGVMITGTTLLTVTNTTTALTLIPGLTTSITVPTQTMVFIQTNGGINGIGTTTTSGSAIDVALLVDGVTLPAGGYQRMYADNPTGNATVTNWVANWNMTVILTLSAGTHTVSVNAAYVAGSNATVSGGATAIKQGTLTIMILKNT